jgi:SAM-dependent methyltransferase
MGDGSVSFEHAAAFYDRTRITDDAQLAAAIEALDVRLPPGRVLEIGVGTGALAVPLARRGRRVVGVDLSPAMLAQLDAKQDGRVVGLAIADATRLPFGDDSFAGAYCRWVLHLIAAWRDAIGELCRVVARPGIVIVELGGYQGEWGTVHRRLVEELGPDAEPIGLRMGDDEAEVDEAFRDHGATLRDVVETPGVMESSLGGFFDQVESRAFSWTWRVERERVDRAVRIVRAWAAERFGPDLDRPFEPDAPHHWRVYELA